MNELILHQENLPVDIDGLHQFILIGEEALIAHQAKVRAISKIEDAQSAKEAALKDGRNIGEAVLWAKAKLGELLAGIPDKPASSARGTRSLPNGITKKQSHYYQQIHKNRDIVEEVISEAAENDDLPTTRETLKRIQRKNQQLKTQESPAMPTGEYRVIVCDPPWPYETQYDSDTRRVASPYPEMSLPEIKETRPTFGDPSVLWLWTTHRFLFDAKEILTDWGFEYKLTFVWNKELLGIGQWLRCQAEFCLLGIKGKLTGLWKLTNQRDILSEPRREHSRKPKAFYEMVETLLPGPLDGTFYLNMYSRENINGWKSWGNEPERFHSNI